MDRKLGHQLVPGEGKEILSVPQWVLDLEVIPKAFRTACFAPGTKENYDPVLWKHGRDFVASWISHKKRGSGLVLMGASGAGKSFGAAAIANEIMHLWGRFEHISVKWLSTQWSLNELFDLRHFHMQEAYLENKWGLYKADLLVIDDIFQIPTHNSFAVISELIAIYQYRMDNLLPTIITGNSNEPLKTLETVFNIPFARRVEDNCKGRIIVMGT